MGQNKKEQIFLKNYVEEIVSNSLDRLSKEGNFCTCPRCRMDIMAYALNHITPKYVVTQLEKSTQKYPTRAAIGSRCNRGSYGSN